MLPPVDPTPPPRRTDRAQCGHCQATPASCDTNHWLRGRWCCTACPGRHDDQETSA
jgi:hypothetical protein